MANNFTIKEAQGKADMEIVRAMILRYMGELGEDLCFQGVNEELAKLPWPYERPQGVIYLAQFEGDAEPCAMIAMKKLDDEACEMKRLYVEPEKRACGIGVALVEKLLAEAKSSGYKIMRLDTLDRLKAAIAIYERYGFYQTKPYNDAPLEGITYFEKVL